MEQSRPILRVGLTGSIAPGHTTPAPLLEEHDPSRIRAAPLARRPRGRPLAPVIAERSPLTVHNHLHTT